MNSNCEIRQRPLILDTTVLRNTDFLYWLGSSYHGRISVSPIAYMENKRQLYTKCLDAERLDRTLRKANITIGSFGKNEAVRAAKTMSCDMKVCDRCKKIDWADTMIYASLGDPSTILVTDNVSDFPDDKRVKRPKEVMVMYDRS